MSGRAPSTLAGLLSLRAAASPDKIAVRCQDETITYAGLERRAARLAAGLAASGVRPGEMVAVLFETSLDYVAAWLAISWLGAVEAPLNTGLRGPALAHALRLTGARVILLDACHAEVLAGAIAETPALERAVVRGEGPTEALGALRIDRFEALEREPLAEAAPGRPGDPAMLLFTSGSTGPSKACVIPNRYLLRQPEIFCAELGIRPDDVLYAPFPLFHADGAVFTVAAALSAGATAALAPRFSVSGFWDDCRRHGATVIDYMGATLSLLFRQPPSPEDRNHGVRLGWGVPAPPWADAFEQRFGLELVEIYGLSDAGIVLYNRPGEPRRQGSCGRAAGPFEVRVLDEDGFEAAAGEVGELVIRPREPHLVLSAYLGDPAATADAFRDLWFHTGDLMRRDADGWFYFVGRMKDVIRRRGENISAFDLEQALLAHPDIVEAAAYGVPSELTEEDVMVSLVLRPDARLGPTDIIDWAARRLTSHMVPRYLRIVASIPRTETEKAAKQELKALGVTPDAYDREAAPDRTRRIG